MWTSNPKLFAFFISGLTAIQHQSMGYRGMLWELIFFKNITGFLGMWLSLKLIFLTWKKCSIIKFLLISQLWLEIQRCDLPICILKGPVTICGSFFLNSMIVTYRKIMMGCLKSSDFFCCSSGGSVLVLLLRFCIHVWRRETDSKSISTEYRGLTVGTKLLEYLDPIN